VWITLLFLVYALYKGDYFIRPNVQSILNLSVSILILFTAFIIQGASWKIQLNKYQLKISNRNGIIAFGISVFGKYVPGKIWMLLGKVGYTKLKYDFPIDILMAASINAQFISLWVGLLVGIPFLFFVNISYLVTGGVIASFITLTILIFNSSVNIFINRLTNKWFKKDFNLPNLNFLSTIKIFPVNFLFWSLYGIAFYFFLKGFSNYAIELQTLFIFPLASTLGILMIIAPGGIGVREGIMVTLLTHSGFSIDESITLSILNRLWSIIGELFIFLLANFLKFTHER